MVAAAGRPAAPRRLVAEVDAADVDGEASSSPAAACLVEAGLVGAYQRRAGRDTSIAVAAAEDAGPVQVGAASDTVRPCLAAAEVAVAGMRRGLAAARTLAVAAGDLPEGHSGTGCGRCCCYYCHTCCTLLAAAVVVDSGPVP